MIRCNLNLLLAERGLRIAKVVKDTKVTRPTLTAIVQNSGKGIQFDTLNTLCNYLNITPCEFFSYIPYEFEVSVSNYEVTKVEVDGALKIGGFSLGIAAFDKKSNLLDRWSFQCQTKLEHSIDFSDEHTARESEHVDILNIEVAASEESDFTKFANFLKGIDSSWRYTIRDYVRGEVHNYFASSTFSTVRTIVNGNGINSFFESLDARPSQR